MRDAAAGDADVVIIGPKHVDSFAANIASGFEDLGVGATVVDPFARISGRQGTRTYARSGAVMRKLAEESGQVRNAIITRPVSAALSEVEPRLVISAYGYFKPEEVEAWRELTPAANWVLWYPDAFVNLGPHHCLLAPYDYLFFKDPYIVEKFRDRAGVPARYLAEACNPRLHRPPAWDGEAVESEYDVGIVGNLYPYRLLTLESLRDGLDLRIYGNLRSSLPARFEHLSRSHMHKVVFGRDKARAFNQARIVLSTMHFGEVDGVNCRLFEATGCGAFVLTHRNDALSRYFDVGRELVAFDTPAEMNAAIDHYLHTPDERREIAAAAARRAHRDHTYAVRLRHLIREIGLERDDVLRVATEHR